MWRVLLFLALIGVAGAGAVWLADNPETVAITWAGREYTASLAVGAVAVVVLAILISLVWAVMRWLAALPSEFGRNARARKRERGLTALTRGIVAVGAGDVAAARRYANEAERLIGSQPLALLLKAQAAQAAGNRAAAEDAFRRMTAEPETRVLGLRGLYLEASRQGDTSSARRYAAEAAHAAPAVAWANEAVLEGYSADRDWSAAIATVERRASLGLVDKATGRRQRAVLNAAFATDREEIDPPGALRAALEAVRLAPDLVPAAAIAGRLLALNGDLRRAAKVVEAAWAASPHPDLAAVYLNLRSGDSAADRLARAETLARLSSWAPESRFAIARAAMEARDAAKARAVMQPLLDGRPTVRTCLAMAEIEGIDGQSGRVREWLARATRAPRDPAWIADGVVSERWAPLSPVTGRLDAFRWETPPEALGAPAPDKAPFPDEPEPAEVRPAAPVIEASPAAASATPASAVEAPAEAEPASPAPKATPPDPVVVVPPARPEPLPFPRPSTNGSGFPPAREPEPVVFPVRRAPDDPGAEDASRPAGRLT